jgi:hypothetical protein
MLIEHRGYVIRFSITDTHLMIDHVEVAHGMLMVHKRVSVKLAVAARSGMIVGGVVSSTALDVAVGYIQHAKADVA